MNAGGRDGGFALVETIVLVALLLIPIVWMLGALSRVHQAALAVTSAAREAADAAGRSVDPSSAMQAGRAAAEAALLDQGLSPAVMRMKSAGMSSLERGGEVSVRIGFPVRIASLPWTPHDPSIWVSAVHTVEVDRYRSRP